MMADLWAWMCAWPVLASVLMLMLWLTSGLFVAVLFGLSRLPANTLDAAHGDDDDEPPAPIVWGRAGGNWWPGSHP